jgi:hypothetical protein
MKTVLLSFEDAEVRNAFLEVVKSASDTMIGSSDVPEGFEQRKTSGELIKSALNTIKLDPPIKENHERTVAIFVTGSKLYEGQMAEMNKVFAQECNSHSGSVVMKELIGGEWTEVRTRRQA